MRRKSHVRFLGGGETAMSPCYPTSTTANSDRSPQFDGILGGFGSEWHRRHREWGRAQKADNLTLLACSLHARSQVNLSGGSWFGPSLRGSRLIGATAHDGFAAGALGVALALLPRDTRPGDRSRGLPL